MSHRLHASYLATDNSYHRAGGGGDLLRVNFSFQEMLITVLCRSDFPRQDLNALLAAMLMGAGVTNNPDLAAHAA